jgi:hypothetical protein
MSKLSLTATGAAFVMLGVMTLHRWNSVKHDDDAVSLRMPRIQRPRSDSSAMSDSDRHLIVARDVFRLSRAPSDLRYGESAAPTTLAPAQYSPRTTRPSLVLRAVAGPPWQAIIDGLPGQSMQTVARAGATFDRLTIRTVTRDTVVVSGPDTTWVLTLSRRS